MAVLAQIDAWDPVAAAPVTLRVATHDDPAVCHLAGEVWWPCLQKAPSLKYDLFDGAFGNAIDAPSCSMTMLTGPFPNFGRFALMDARVQLWRGKAGDDFSRYVRLFDGRMSTQPKTEDFSAAMDIAVDDAWLDTPLLATYAGTTGAEGAVDLTGQPKPLVLGSPRYVPGVLIDSINSVFQVMAYGALPSVDAVLDKLVRYSASLGDFPTYDALVAADIPAGRWATSLAAGMVRLGAPPAGKVSFLVSSAAMRAGAMIRQVALLSGGAGKIDDASLDALDAARPWPLSLYVGEQTTARELIQSIAQSVNATAGVSWLGAYVIEVQGRATDWQGAGALAQFGNTDFSQVLDNGVLSSATTPDGSGYANRDGGSGAYTRNRRAHIHGGHQPRSDLRDRGNPCDVRRYQQRLAGGRRAADLRSGAVARRRSYWIADLRPIVG